MSPRWGPISHCNLARILSMWFIYGNMLAMLLVFSGLIHLLLASDAQGDQSPLVMGLVGRHVFNFNVRRLSSTYLVIQPAH